MIFHTASRSDEGTVSRVPRQKRVGNGRNRSHDRNLRTQHRIFHVRFRITAKQPLLSMRGRPKAIPGPAGRRLRQSRSASPRHRCANLICPPALYLPSAHFKSSHGRGACTTVSPHQFWLSPNMHIFACSCTATTTTTSSSAIHVRAPSRSCRPGPLRAAGACRTRRCRRARPRLSLRGRYSDLGPKRRSVNARPSLRQRRHRLPYVRLCTSRLLRMTLHLCPPAIRRHRRLQDATATRPL